MKKTLRSLAMLSIISIQILCLVIMAGSFGKSLLDKPLHFGAPLAFFVLGIMTCLLALSFIYYAYMDVRTYTLALPILLLCMITRLCSAELFLPALTEISPVFSIFGSYGLYIGLCYLQQAASVYYLNQFFHLNMNIWTARVVSIFCFLLYFIYFITPGDIYAEYFQKICPIMMFAINFLMFFQLIEKLAAKQKFIFNAAFQYTAIECNLIIDLLCLGGYTGNGAHIISVGCMAAFILLFLLAYSKQVSAMYNDNRRIVQMQADITNANIKLLLSQIQPHFLYNTLNAICALCYTDPKRAGEAIVQFSKYLKSNMKSIEKTEPAEFSEELLHVRSYIWIEKMRLGDRLNVVYDLQETDFFIPLLTVEPLVENAIRHGISKRVSGGTLTIRTSKDLENYYIQIVDDGVGFGDGEMSEYHFSNTDSVGIKNVSKRLEMMMHGKLEITSRKNVGTTATITCP